MRETIFSESEFKSLRCSLGFCCWKHEFLDTIGDSRGSDPQVPPTRKLQQSRASRARRFHAKMKMSTWMPKSMACGVRKRRCAQEHTEVPARTRAHGSAGAHKSARKRRCAQWSASAPPITGRPVFLCVHGAWRGHPVDRTPPQRRQKQTTGLYARRW